MYASHQASCCRICHVRFLPRRQCLSALSEYNLLERCTAYLQDQQSLRIVFNALEGNYALCLLANLLHLAYLQPPEQLAAVLCPDLSVSSAQWPCSFPREKGVYRVLRGSVPPMQVPVESLQAVS